MRTPLLIPEKNGLFEGFLYGFVGNHLFFEDVSAGLGRLNHLDDLAVGTAFAFLERCNGFLCHILDSYLISLWMVIRLRMGLYFLSSSLSVVFLRFLVVMYREVPGIPLALCSVHSRITCTRLPFAFFAIFCQLFEVRGNRCRSLLHIRSGKPA